MKGDAISLRQVAVLTVTGLLAPAADLLPGLLGSQAGRAAWLVPLLVLPAALAGTALWRSLERERSGGFRWSYPIYIMWGVTVLASRLSHAARRLGAVYTAGAGLVFAALVLALSLWMVWRGPGGLCRAAELFWLAMGVTVAALLLLSLPQLRLERLIPDWEELSALPGAWTDCLGVVGTAALAAPLAARAAEGKKEGRLWGWTAAACLLLAALSAAVLGQVGAQLTAKLEQPFSIMVQGLSLKGGFARLEAPVAALWLLADFAALGLPLAAIRVLAGERGGRWAALAAAAAAAGVGVALPGWDRWMILGGLWLGNFLPAGCWVLCKLKREKE